MGDKYWNPQQTDIQNTYQNLDEFEDNNLVDDGYGNGIFLTLRKRISFIWLDGEKKRKEKTNKQPTNQYTWDKGMKWLEKKPACFYLYVTVVAGGLGGHFSSTKVESVCYHRQLSGGTDPNTILPFHVHIRQCFAAESNVGGG